MTEITPYDIAHVIGVLLDRTHTNDGGMIGAHVSNEALHIDLTSRDGATIHFRAVVVEGEHGDVIAHVTAQDYHATRDDATGRVELRIGGPEGTVVIDLGEDGDEILAGLLTLDDDVIVLERPAELGLSNDEGEDLLVLNDSGIIRLYPPDAAWFDLRPDEAREMAAQLAAMADAAEVAFPQLAGGHQAGSEAGR